MDPLLAVPASSWDHRPTFAANFGGTGAETSSSDDGIEPLTAPNTQPRHFGHGKLFSLKNNKTKLRAANTAANFGGRSYDYTERYAQDEWGAEMSPESRVYKTYLDESEVHDTDKMEGYRDVLDVLLVFTGLFSAIVTTFVVQTSQTLQPDYGQITAVLVYNLILVQQAVNGTATVSLPHNPADAQAIPSMADIWVNGLWFTSLAISLSTALIAVVTKQWLSYYMSQSSGSSQDRARLRQFRSMGLDKYRVPLIIDLLPVALHVALALFLAGLALFLHGLNAAMTIIVGVISGAAYTLYLISTVVPLYDPQCPYQSPLSSYLHRSKVARYVSDTLQLWAVHCGLFCVQKCTAARRRFTEPKDDSPSAVQETLGLQVKWLTYYLSHKPSSFQARERQAVSYYSDQLDIDIITWLHSTSSNSSVRDTAFQAVVGLEPSNADTKMLQDSIQPYYDNLHRSCIEGVCWVIEGREADYHHLMQAACLNGFDTGKMYWNNDVLAPIEDPGYQVYQNVIMPYFYKEDGPITLDMSQFLPPGHLSNARLPLSVWRHCIPEILKFPLDPVFVTRILQERILSVYKRNVCNSPSTFAEALRNHSFLACQLMDVLADSLNISKESFEEYEYGPHIYAVINWALPHLDDLSSECNVPSVWGIQSQATALLVIGTALDALSAYDVGDSILDVCMRVLTHKLTIDLVEHGRQACSQAMSLIWYHWDYHEAATCAPGLLHAILDYLDRPSSLEDANYTTRDIIPRILRNNADPAMFYNILRDRDEMPLKLAQIGGDWSTPSLLWRYEMLRAAVFSCTTQEIDRTAEWAVEWLKYINCPDRLYFIFSRLIQADEWSELLPLRERATPLFELTRTSPNWAGCFEMLIRLLESDAYIKSIWQCDDPRYQLCEVLVHMQQDFDVDLSMFCIPRFNPDGSIILTLSSPTDVIPLTGSLPVIEQALGSTPKIPAGTEPSEEDAHANTGRQRHEDTSIARAMESDTTAVVHITPKQLEEGVELQIMGDIRSVKEGRS